VPLHHPKEKEKKRKIKIVSVLASHNIKDDEVVKTVKEIKKVGIKVLKNDE